MAQIYSRSEIAQGAVDETAEGGRLHFVPVTAAELGEWQELLIQAQEAAEGDSNDKEIEVLRDAVEFTCKFFGGEL